MKIAQLYTYPIKSLRGVPLPTTEVTAHGFPYDRRFMLLKVHNDDTSSTKKPRLENMLVGHFNEMALFLQKIRVPGDGDDAEDAVVEVRYTGVGKEANGMLEVPLVPEVDGLDVVDVELHQSATKAYRMGEIYDRWFSSCFGYEVMLVYLGPHLRTALGNLAPSAADTNTTASKSWLPSVARAMPNLGLFKLRNNDGITFADVAPYLVVTEESLRDVSSRLANEEMDITKFRPNIVLSGSPAAYEEDFWGGLTIGSRMKSGEKEGSKVEVTLTQNCARCKSINIDYSTGKQSADEAGTVLKKLMRDRRVDKGMKYSPIFGRYAFLNAMETSTKTISLGDEVTVSKRNEERTKFSWPGLTK